MTDTDNTNLPPLADALWGPKRIRLGTRLAVVAINADCAVVEWVGDTDAGAWYGVVGRHDRSSIVREARADLYGVNLKAVPTNTIAVDCPVPPGVVWGPRRVWLDGPDEPPDVCILTEDGDVKAKGRLCNGWVGLSSFASSCVMGLIARESIAWKAAHDALRHYTDNMGHDEWVLYLATKKTLRTIGAIAAEDS